MPIRPRPTWRRRAETREAGTVSYVAEADRAPAPGCTGDDFCDPFERDAGVRGAWAFDDRDLWVNHYGPAKTLAASLDDSRRAEFRRDMIAWHEAFPSPLGFDQPRAYLVTSARRK